MKRYSSKMPAVYEEGGPTKEHLEYVDSVIAEEQERIEAGRDLSIWGPPNPLKPQDIEE